MLYFPKDVKIAQKQNSSYCSTRKSTSNELKLPL
jgi:hypothetical protein